MTPNSYPIPPPPGEFLLPLPQPSQSPQHHVEGLSSPNDAPTPRRRRRAFPIPYPPKPLIFKWRCCQPWCDNSRPPASNTLPINVNTRANTTHTTVHFKWVWTRLGDEGDEACIWQPGYREEKCSRCSHPACSDCLLVNVDGWTEWRGESGESATGKGIWARLGIWDADAPESGRISVGSRVDQGNGHERPESLEKKELSVD
ncbi:hypothetical protein K458DRAFT_394472 [Lentithecium fluviatile CBS 122367]|uniref:Uncharacterized protein n=1 Tax=Lentithecium fluviatile CBS 122367 TaxID=1168545 RepID=A0A6G1IL57_9PLEO|nr:hypothetical protein K458DRAFT_394472 [Lentithecium fluviatile CBS 122367]